MRLDIRVTPRASRNAVGGMRDGRLVVKVTAPPVDDAANEAVIVLLAKTLGLPKRSVRITSGHTSRAKVVEVDGLTAEQAHLRLGSHSST